jgi:hypothetical protein
MLYDDILCEAFMDNGLDLEDGSRKGNQADMVGIIELSG